MVLSVRSEIADEGLARPSWVENLGRKEHLIWLDKNENTDPEYLSLVAGLLNNVPASALYGYPDCSSLYHKLAGLLCVQPENLYLSAGSDGVIRAAYEVFAGRDVSVIHPDPTFAMYYVYGRIYGVNSNILSYLPATQPNEAPQLAIDRLLQLIQEKRPALVCLPNPDSPTGSIEHLDVLRQILLVAKEVGATVLIDEAYHPFYQETAISLLGEFENLIVTQTFSKAWGLAGARVGYAVTSPKIANLLHKVRPMYELGALSVEMVTRVLDLETEMLASVARILAGKQYFLDEMKKLNYAVIENSQGNFMHVNFSKKAECIHSVLQDIVLYREKFSHPALQGFSRFTASTKEVLQPIVNAIQCVTTNELIV